MGFGSESKRFGSPSLGTGTFVHYGPDIFEIVNKAKIRVIKGKTVNYFNWYCYLPYISFLALKYR